MATVFSGVRKGDVALAAVLTALGVLMMLENILSDPDGATRIDSQSWLLVPVFAAATLPILWRRRSMTGVYVVTAAALAVHLLAFDHLVRCGAGLPLAFALAYSAGRLQRGWASLLGLVASLGIQVLVLLYDTAAGLSIIPVTAVIGVAAWGVGAWLQRRSEITSSPTTAPVESYV
jgi:hypothetical protein